MESELHLIIPGASIFSYISTFNDLLFRGWSRSLVCLLVVPVQPGSLLDSTVPSSSMHRRQVERHAKRTAEDVASFNSTQHPKRAKLKNDNSDIEIGSKSGVMILDLPVEIHRMIFSHLESIEDVLCFGATNECFWGICAELLHKYYMSLIGKGAGHEIALIERKTNCNDLPSGIVLEEDVDTPNLKLTQYLAGHTRGGPLVSIESIPDGFWAHIREADDLLRSCMLRPGFGEHAFEIFSQVNPCPRYSDYIPEEQEWILRDLTTKEFVRAESIALKPEYIHGPHIDVFGFGEVIASRICWSTSPLLRLEDGSDISKGVWAGHKLDITTIGAHKAETKGEVWRDIGDEIIREVGNIWKSKYGPDWRQTICNPRDQDEAITKIKARWRR